MAQHGLFSESRVIHWPAEYGDIVNMLKGLDATGQPSHPALYRFNTGPVVLAAIVGLVYKRERDVGAQRQEISTDTFESQKFGNSSLSAFILLIPLIGTHDLDLLRPEREEELIRIFERYAAGGFEYFRGALSTCSDSTGRTIIKKEIEHALRAYAAATEHGDVKI
jgi:hypothetical protein